ncbi:DUF1963 domain-containing protein [Clostridium felsineum]|uniref:YwqG family protein n=1 Tax=Clostridium felsineum TaxID=36839 RepID=UPI00214D7F80|nr:YwqG family protein [Clostridium felsineum]MCR3759229.1 DUF1963 domain-containing protein [Clostridium felsineum]
MNKEDVLRIPCKNSECKGMPLLSTVEKTGGYCMPCFTEIKRKEKEKYIKKNRKDINLYEGITDLVEILIIMHNPKKYDPFKNYLPYEKTVEEIYEALTLEDIQKLKGYVIQLIKEKQIDKAEEIIIELACFTKVALTDCLEILIKSKNYRPSIGFKGASEEVRDVLIEEIEKNENDRNELLLALSWIGDKRIVSLFNEWKSQPPVWKEKLYIEPEEYALEAGWELDEKGKKRELFYKESYALVDAVKINKNDNPVKILSDLEEKCPWCNSPLIVLFEFDLSHPSLEFLKLSGKRLRIATCDICTCYGTIYTEIDGEGNYKWSSFNKKPSYLPDVEDEEEIQYNNNLVLAQEKRSCYHAASPFAQTSISQIGGHPTWLQDAEYPKCPKCNKSMKFIGQIDSEDVMEYGEGVKYAFICEECNIAATNYQQT